MSETTYLDPLTDWSDVPPPAEPADPEAFPVPHTQVGERGTGRRAGSVERGSMLFGDVAGLLSGELPDPPAPTILTRDDGRAIFYAGQVNSLFADAESGKTMVTCAAIEEVLKNPQGRAVFCDIDHNGILAIVRRLIDLGVPAAVLSDPDRFRYVEPEDRTELRDLVAFLRTWRPDLVVVDSVGELLPMFGLSSNSPDDYTTVHAQVLKPLAAAGACVVSIDHVAKNTASAESGPTGTNAKRRAVGGVSIRVKVKEQFVPGHGGSVWLMVNKDRHGGLRQHCPTGDREPSAGLFTLRPDGTESGMTWNLRAPNDSDTPQIDGVSVDDLAALSALDPPPASVRDVKDRMSWRTDRAAAALRTWRTRTQGVPREQGTPELSSVPRTPPPVSGTGNTPTDRDSGSSSRREQARACGHPGNPATRCGTCIAERANVVADLDSRRNATRTTT